MPEGGAASATPSTTPGAAPGLADLFRVRGMKALTGAMAIGSWGDYIARICVASAVLERTGSALLSATVFAVSLLPTLVGRTAFGPIADRHPYRRVVMSADLIRAVLATVLAIALGLHSPTLLLLVLLFVLELAGGPVVTAQSAMILDFLPDARYYNRAAAVSETLDQTNQAVGLIIGGALAVLVGPTWGLGFDALTFVVIMLTVWRVIPAKEVVPDPDAQPSTYLQDLGSGARYLRRHRMLVAIVLLMLAAVLGVTAPEASGLAFARQELGALQYGGLLMATPIVGMIVGLLLVSRWDGVTQIERVRPMALLMPVPLLFVALHPSIATAVPLFFASGILSAFVLPLQATFLPMVAQEYRGRVYGIASALTVAAGGVAYLAVGALTTAYGPARAVSISGVISLVLIIVVLSRWPGRQLHESAERIYRS